MKNLDKQFEEMMKGVKIESPSSDFALKVMSRVLAEADVTRRPLLQNYQPLISKRTWIILFAAFITLIVYISFFGNDLSTASDPGFWSAFKGSLSKISTVEASIWKKGIGLFSTVPAVAYLIVIASLSLWTLDSFLNRLRQDHSRISLK